MNNVFGISLCSRVFLVVTIFSALGIVTSAGASSTEFVTASPSQSFSPEDLESFIGNWQNKGREEKIYVHSITPNGLAKVNVVSVVPVTVKKAIIEKVAGIITFLVIEVTDGDKLSGLYNLTYEDGLLVGTFDDIIDGGSQDVTFKPLPKEESKAVIAVTSYE